MAGPWLYCIRAVASRDFNFEGQSSIPVNSSTYRMLVETGRITEYPLWYITRNWKKVEPGDEVFIYTGDDDLGIIGFATVQEVEQRPDAQYPCLRLDFDLHKSRALLKKPIPAPLVREWLHSLQGNVLNLGPFASDLSARLPWARN